MVVLGINAIRYNQKFLIQRDTITGPYIQDIGDPLLSTEEGGGQAAFSPDGKLYVYYNPLTELQVFDFDRSTGLLDNYRTTALVDSPLVQIGGIAFSPNSRFLYVSNAWDLYQFDLQANELEASRVHIGHFDGFTGPNSILPANFYQGLLGPDCKVYFWTSNTTQYLHVIHQPDLKGHACQLEKHGIETPVYTGSPPNFPNYRLGSGPVCDSTISMISTAVPIVVESDQVSLYPNPAAERVRVAWYKPLEGRLVLADLHGRPVLERPIGVAQREAELSVAGLPEAVYLLRIRTKEGDTITKKLVIAR